MKYCILCMTAPCCDQHCQISHWEKSHHSTCTKAYPPPDPVIRIAYSRAKSSRSKVTQVIAPVITSKPTKRLTKERVTAVQDAAWLQCACHDCANPVSLAEQCCDICDLCWVANGGPQWCIRGPSGNLEVGDPGAVDPDHCQCTCPLA